MATIAKTTYPESDPLRPLNIIKDLPRVADLVESCFLSTMDAEGKQFIQQMRKAGQDNHWIQWATNAVESVSLPLSGFVWEEEGQIVGNISLIPYREHSKKVYLIANVAVHPDFRRRGIACSLTKRAIERAWLRGSESVWLHVRDDNQEALKLYESLGFIEMTRRTQWSSPSVLDLAEIPVDYEFRKRKANEWEQHKTWLRSLYPEELDWYLQIPWKAIQPGFFSWIHNFLLEIDSNTWMISRNRQLLAAFTEVKENNQISRLWIAFPAIGEESALSMLLNVCLQKINPKEYLSIDLPAGIATNSMRQSGFSEQRTLIWMRLNKTNFNELRK